MELPEETARPQRSPARHLMASILLLFVSIGCGVKSCDTAGLEELAADEPRYVAFPGLHLGHVEQDETPLQLLGNQGIPSAMLTRNGKDRLRVVPFNGSAPCEVGPIMSRDDKFGRSVHPALDEYIPFHSRIDDDRTELHIMDAHCRQKFGPYSNAALVASSFTFEPEQFVLLTDQGQLLTVQPNEGVEKVIARDVSKAVQSGAYLYTIEAGRVTLRNRALKKIGSFGDGTVELGTLAGTGKAAFVDKHGLFTLDPSNPTPRYVAASACHIYWADADEAALALYYQRDCDDPSLMLSVISEELPLALPPEARAPIALRELSHKTQPACLVVSYFVFPSTTDDSEKKAPSDIGIRYIGPWGSPASAVGWAHSARSIGDAVNDKLLLWVDPETDSSRLVEWSLTSTKTYLTGVLDFTNNGSPMRALVRKGSITQLVGTSIGKRPSILLDDADGLGKKFGSSLLVASGTKGALSDVYYLKDARAPELMFYRTLEPLSQVIWNEVAVASLTEYSKEELLGTFCVRMITSADTFCQPQVRTYMPTIRPARGVAYVSARHGQASLHWAQAR